MPQTAEEYMTILYEAEQKVFGFTGTAMPFHIKELVLEFDQIFMPEDEKERLADAAGMCVNHRYPLPEGVRIMNVKILFVED